MSKTLMKEANTHGENPLSRKDMRGKPKMLNYWWWCFFYKINVDVWRNIILGKKRNMLTWNIKNCRMETRTM